jgi:flagellar biosynthesis protein FliQ
MRSFNFENLFYDGMMSSIVIAGPLLAIAAIVGFVIAIFQAATQIQDQTLPQIVKVVILVLVVQLFGARLSSPIVEFTERQFTHLEGTP